MSVRCDSCGYVGSRVVWDECETRGGPGHEAHVRDAEPIHAWFGLTYSNYLVLHRAVLQSMPDDWQARFVGMLDELRETCDRAKLECPNDFRVHVVDARGRFIRDPIPHYRRAPNLLEGR